MGSVARDSVNDISLSPTTFFLSCQQLKQNKNAQKLCYSLKEMELNRKKKCVEYSSVSDSPLAGIQKALDSSTNSAPCGGRLVVPALGRRIRSSRPAWATQGCLKDKICTDTKATSDVASEWTPNEGCAC